RRSLRRGTRCCCCHDQGVVMDIERIKLGDAASFYRDYVQRSRPVVIEEFWAPDAIDRAREIGRASRDPTLPSEAEPSRLFDENTLGALLAETGSVTAWMPAPGALRAVLLRQIGGLHEPDTRSELWAGTTSSFTALHYDIDLRANVLVQVFGHKRITIA